MSFTLEMSEASILEKIRIWCESTHTSSAQLGVGDDAAIVRGTNRDFLFCSDLMIEGTHFDCNYSSASDIGYKVGSPGTELEFAL